MEIQFVLFSVVSRRPTIALILSTHPFRLSLFPIVIIYEFCFFFSNCITISDPLQELIVLIVFNCLIWLRLSMSET